MNVLRTIGAACSLTVALIAWLAAYAVFESGGERAPWIEIPAALFLVFAGFLFIITAAEIL